MVQSLPYGAQAELFGVNVLRGYPEAFGGVVAGLQRGAVFHLALEEKVERLHVEPGVSVDVGLAEQVACAGDAQARFLHHLARHALLRRFEHVGEASGQVERALRRFHLAPLHEQFPKLVDEEGWGWFSRHFHRAMQFALAHPDLVHKNYAASAGKLDKLFDQEWRSKVLQYQTENLSTLTEGAWTIRFDDMIADALELGPLRCTEPELPAELAERLEQIRPEKMPSNILPTLVAYYLANRPEDSDWVVLPVTNFDCYFGNTNFGRKYLNQLPQEVIERSNSFGISRYRVREEYLPK